MSEAFTRVGKQILANGYHYADGADETAAQFVLDALNAHVLTLAASRYPLWHPLAYSDDTDGIVPTPPIINSVEG